MLRVGLTGGLGSGKSTVARLLGELGATVLVADEVGRQLMEPGTPVFQAIVRHFGDQVICADGTLDRAVLAQLAFAGGRLEELNALVHPAVLAVQAELAQDLAQRDPGAILVVESALLFETKHAGAGGWKERFDRIVLVTAPELQKIERFVLRAFEAGSTERPSKLRESARQRLAAQLPDEQKRALADFEIVNDGTLGHLRTAVARLWDELRVEARRLASS